MAARPPLPVAHVSLGRSQTPGLGIPTCVGCAGRSLPEMCRMSVHPHMRGEQVAKSGPDHPHVRGADVHEPNGAALQRTTRRRGFPQFWGCGAQASLVDVERTTTTSVPGLSHA